MKSKNFNKITNRKNENFFLISKIKKEKQKKQKKNTLFLYLMIDISKLKSNKSKISLLKKHLQYYYHD